MTKIFLAILFISIILIRCTQPAPPDVEELGVKITKITFGSGWDSSTNQLTNVGTIFPYGTTKIYYEICFEKAFIAGGMIKKKWKREGSQFLEVTSFIPKSSKRICGEIHYYAEQNMDTGTYNISVFWYSSEEGNYVEYNYNGANRSFEIE